MTEQLTFSLSFSHWSGLSFPNPGDLLDPGAKLASPVLAGRFFITESPGKAHIFCIIILYKILEENPNIVCEIESLYHRQTF